MLSLGAPNLHKMLSGFDDKSAQAVCTFGYCEGPGHEALLFQGRTDGKLVESRGSTVFGELASVPSTKTWCRLAVQ
jgi:inosine triphosphate pyrophosphatase